MKTRNLEKSFDCIQDLGYQNLLVGGCSFTYNNSDEHIVTWPYYLRDLCDFDHVFDCSLPGAGNYHISQSIMWEIESNNFNPAETLIIIMWSGFKRDDAIIDSNLLNNFPFTYNYTENTVSGITGGITSSSNVQDSSLRNLKDIKSSESRAIENFLYINSLYNFLQNKNFNFLFLNYIDYDLPNLSGEENVVEHLPSHIRNRYQNLTCNEVENIYKFCLKNDLLDDDDFHPSPYGHLVWTKKHLVPYLLAHFKT